MNDVSGNFKMNEIIWTATENIITVFEAFSLIWYICGMNEYDPFLPEHRKKYMVGSVILSLISVFLYELVGFAGVWTLIYVAYYFVYALIVTKEKMVTLPVFCGHGGADTYLHRGIGGKCSRFYTKYCTE